MLHEIQQAFARAILKGDAEPEFAAAIAAPDGEGAERLAVYRNTFLGTLTNALRLNFPAVERLVGRDYFEGAAVRFALAHPPLSACLNAFGAGFPSFLATLPSAQGLTYLPGVARLDWAFSQALSAPDAPAADLAALARAGDDVRLRLHPALHLLSEDLPVDEIWRAVLSGDEDALAAIDLAHGRRHLLVERQALGARVARIDETDWLLLARIEEGLGAALQHIDPAAAPHRLAAHLALGRIIAADP